jgi:3-hydroxyacyl-[acyl-carrier-protein] dehydratase
VNGMESPEVQDLFRTACRSPLTDSDGVRPTVLDRAAIEGLLPHRDPFLLLDRITLLDRDEPLIVGAYDLSRAESVFSGHFPGAPVWPGVLQVEAVAQAGLVLARSLASADESGAGVALTHILGAQFMKAITPGGEVEIAARIIEDGLFLIIVGQCLRNGEVCSAAAIRGL